MRLIIVALSFWFCGIALAQEPPDDMTLPQQREALPPNLEHSTAPLVSARKREALLKSEALIRPSGSDVWGALQQGMQDKAEQTMIQDKTLASVRAQVLAIANHAADLQERLDALCDRFDKDRKTEFCGANK